MTSARRAAGATLAALAAFVPWLATSCQVVGGFADFGGADAGAARHPCDVLPTRKTDARGLTTLVLVKEQDRCFWAERGETPVSDYAEFVRAGAPRWDAARCGWKTAISDPAGTPNDPCVKEVWPRENDPFGPTKPIRCIDWCDAKAYCEWLDGSLCGSIPVSVGTMEPIGSDDWRFTCAGPDLAVFPYGDAARPGACNLDQTRDACAGTELSPCGPYAAGQAAECVAPNGAVDLLGNVAEWVLPCQLGASTPADANCLRKGGSFADASATTTCNVGSLSSAKRSARDPYTGMRCCFPLSAAEQSQIGAKP